MQLPINLNKIICSLFLLVLAGCGSESHLKKAEQFVAQVESEPPPKVEPLPEVHPQQKIKYIEQNMRNPFTPPQPEQVNPGLSPDTNRPKEALEQFPLDSLRMVGTITQDDRQWALISAPDKTIYKVTTGSHMGQNYGRIDKISDNRIDIVETIPDGLGGWKERSAYLSLVQ